MNIIDKIEEFRELLENISVSDFNSPEQNFENIEQISQALLQTIPPQVYRFRSCADYSIDALNKDEIWGALAISLNDPMECQPFYDIDKINECLHHELGEPMITNNINNFTNGNIPKLAQDIFGLAKLDIPTMIGALSQINPAEISQRAKSMLFPFFQERLDAIIDNFWLKFFDFKQFLHIACFAENLHSTLMWSHYADSHSGFAVEYDMTKYVRECSKKCKDMNSCSAFHTNLQFAPILYSEHKYDATSTLRQVMEHEMVSEIYKMIPQTQIEDDLYKNMIKEVDKFKVNKLVLTKSSDWSYEKEWRLFTYDMTRAQPEHKCISTGLLPSAIYLGTKISEENKEKIVAICQKKKIPCYKMLNSYTTKEFNVYPDKISPLA